MKIEKIVVHCSDSPDDRHIDAQEIHRWHKERGWDGIGYHAVIKRDGQREPGRPWYWSGAHVRGHNHNSYGICLVGRDRFSQMQMHSLVEEIATVRMRNGRKIPVVNHHDLDDGKTCPNFDVREELGEGFCGMPEVK